MADIQTERAFQKQPHVSLCSAKISQIDKKTKKPLRYHREVGLGIKTPREAINGTYIDRKCPFTGNCFIRGRTLNGVVYKMKMQRTIIVRRDYLYLVPKYHRYERRHKNVAVHLSPCFRDVEVGDTVVIGECRPLSKTVRYNVLKVEKKSGKNKFLKK